MKGYSRTNSIVLGRHAVHNNLEEGKESGPFPRDNILPDGAQGHGHVAIYGHQPVTPSNSKNRGTVKLKVH